MYYYGATRRGWGTSLRWAGGRAWGGSGVTGELFGDRGEEVFFEDFAGAGAGEFFEEVDVAGGFVGGDALADEGAEFVFGGALVGGKVGAELDEGDGGFAAGFVLDAEDGGDDDGGVLLEGVFDFAGEDFFAGHDDHVFFAAGDVEVAFGVEAGDVAGFETSRHLPARHRR